MRCQAWVSDKTGKKSGESEVVLLAFPQFATLGETVAVLPDWEKHYPKSSFGPVRACGGRIVSNIGVEEEAYFGGTSHSLRVQFKCADCGSTNHVGLPGDWEELELNDLLTRLIEQMP